MVVVGSGLSSVIGPLALLRAAAAAMAQRPPRAPQLPAPTGGAAAAAAGASLSEGHLGAHVDTRV